MNESLYCVYYYSSRFVINRKWMDIQICTRILYYNFFKYKRIFIIRREVEGKEIEFNVLQVFFWIKLVKL